MKNVVIFTLSDDNARDSLIKLEQENIINIKAWLGVENGSGVITHDYRNLLSMDVFKNQYEICDDQIYMKVYKHLYAFLDVFSRVGGIPVYEAMNIFNMWVNFYYSLFKENKIEIVIWGDVPHFGVDSIAKNVADAMDIKTIMVLPSLMPNKFWFFLDIEDIGIFDTLKNDAKETVSIKKEYKKDLFYMKDINQKPDKTIKKMFNFGRFFTRLLYLIKKIKENERKDIFTKISLKGYKKVYESFKELYCRNLYVYNINHFFNQSVNLEVKYVYFPLHLQPEVTTSVFGKEYGDQLLAIEKLSGIIPDDWKIYVKENPKQTYYMREENFFKRLSLIPKVVLVSKEYNTYDLIKYSQFVSTITGTAGWEAITGGKNVLVFGLAWYRMLPGVFEYTKNISLDEILSYRISHEDLENKYNQLINKAYNGVIDCAFKVIVEGYTDKENNEFLYDGFKQILNKI